MEGPTYRCLYPNMPMEGEVPNCNEHGVLGIIPGIIGNFQALENHKGGCRNRRTPIREINVVQRTFPKYAKNKFPSYSGK